MELLKSLVHHIRLLFSNEQTEKNGTVMGLFEITSKYHVNAKCGKQLYVHTYHVSDIGLFFSVSGSTTYPIVLNDYFLTWDMTLTYSDNCLEVCLNPKHKFNCLKHDGYVYSSWCTICTSKFPYIRYILTISYRSPGDRDNWTKKVDSKYWLPRSAKFQRSVGKCKMQFTEHEKSDALSVTCQFYVIEGVSSVYQERDAFEKPSSHFSSIFKSLWENRHFGDVTLIVSNNQFCAHKAVLAASSPVFQRMFESEMLGGTESTVEITDVEDTLVELMLKFLYLGPVEEVRNKAHELVYLADKYDITTMREMCLNVLRRKLTLENSVNTLILADRHNLQLLRSSTIRYIVKNVKVIRNRTDFPLLKAYPNLLYEILCEISESVTMKDAEGRYLKNENLLKNAA
ncbi:BTB/POZ and MATH domain-containing protein 1 [Orussus abietinus]|uniref:BTB/POZ and MATH domain-containing protein 1 n=1 Tax=Orussus abietinus TaxID=222816 RepID=UPI00062698B0|nr:BTB/POZ and MATH domain-containing protein 1 [Orussus abietinus]